jgi:hypothetical protein
MKICGIMIFVALPARSMGGLPFIGATAGLTRRPD